MALLTETAVRHRARALTASLRKSAGQALDEMARADSDVTFDVFVSHSSTEPEEILLGLTGVLRDEGLSVYVDRYTDPHLQPSKVSRATATVLRARLRSSLSLLYVYSEHSTKFRWMPWELGFVDGLTGRVGVIPVTRNQENNFAGEEYLNLYPYVDQMPDNVSHRLMLWINRSENFYAPLTKWIRGEVAMTKHQ